MHFLISIIIFIVLLRIVLRMLGLRGHRYGRHHAYYGSNGFGSNRFGRRPGFGGGLFSVLALVALDRLFTRRY